VTLGNPSHKHYGDGYSNALGGGQISSLHNTFDSMSHISRKKRRRKRNKGKNQRVKSYLSSSSGCEDQINEDLIESCSSPDYEV
jgi:hypothetical protein